MKKILLIIIFLGLLPVITWAEIERNDQPQTPVMEVPMTPFIELQPITGKKVPYMKAPFPELEANWSTWITDYIIGIYKLSMWAIVILVIIKIMIGGFLFIISQGNSSKIEEAKSHLFSAFGGLFIIIFAYTILYYTNPSLVNLENIPIIVPNIAGGCPTAEQIQNKETFKALVTGYYKPRPNQTKLVCGNFFAEVALNCSCPANSKRKSYSATNLPPLCNHICTEFDADKTIYCNKTASGQEPTLDSVAADPACFGFGTQIDIDIDGTTKTYTIKDTGDAVKGAHFDIFTGKGDEGLNNALKIGAKIRKVKVKHYVPPKIPDKKPYMPNLPALPNTSPEGPNQG